MGGLDKSAEAISGMFNAIAGKYDRMNHGMSLGIDRLWRRRFVADPPRGLPSGAAVLDLACGPDNSVRYMSRKKMPRNSAPSHDCKAR